MHEGWHDHRVYRSHTLRLFGFRMINRWQRATKHETVLVGGGSGSKLMSATRMLQCAVACRTTTIALPLFCLMSAFGIVHGAAASESLQIVDARVPAADKEGGDLPLTMTIRNEADSADALLRVRCPVANFSERHTVDRGEGAPAMRSIPNIPVPARGTLELKRDGYHVMLLQLRQTLAPGETFKCAIVFQKAGTIETEVMVQK
ncbi:copper chaperone PCu(A)C [Bradyrhizobium sp. ISRA443]|uniref:copper chaperone PCu(A)C n=1 Tax=unclassified Bradyrhizobium TaxID=2631580 RepID=UPI0024795A40|nr:MULTISPECIES: copper chaperone PCu(A)C [unclassified Bradyrhizobium]WGS01908.1 copper chaperone PCu(A)C [Bradyrhizobium sp. ISRA436]WGS08794.1 copper chaperone PCu(A)C [Bradyrhizobium sp. ISRA437]WGS15682.1 copper chaperone PCu(A)C [Bradyrhizobium sp. ISRA443]